MLLSVQEAREILRIDGEDNDIIIIPLLEGIPDYLETTTGNPWDTEPINPLAKTTAGFILQYWYYGPQGDYSDRLKRTIDSLLGVLTTMSRDKDNDNECFLCPTIKFY